MKFLFTTCLCLYCCVFMYAQNITIKQYCEQNQELTLEQVEFLLDLTKSPLYINSIGFEDYNQFLFLTDFQKKSLWHYKQKYGTIKSDYEYMYILGFTAAQAQLLSEVTTTEILPKIYSDSTILSQAKHSLSAYYNYAPVNHSHYKELNSYSGIPLKTVYRYRCYAKNVFLWGATLTNDMGEETQQGILSKKYDYYSAYFQYKPQYSHIKNILIGDYEVKIGQGLLLNQSAFYSKSLLDIPIASKSHFKAHTSSNELSFYRGLATTFSFKNIVISPFFSYKKVDGFFSVDTLAFSVIETGYHRSTVEIERKKNTSYTSYGIVGEINFKSTCLGISFVNHTWFQNPNNFLIHNAGLQFYKTLDHSQIILEYAIDNNKSSSAICGINTAFSPISSATIFLRYIENDFVAYNSNIFSQQSKVSSEKGLAITHDYKLGSNQLKTGIDLFKITNNELESKAGFEALFGFKTNSYKKYNFYSYHKIKISNQTTESKYSKELKNTINGKHTLQYKIKVHAIENSILLQYAYSKNYMKEQGFFASFNQEINLNKNSFQWSLSFFNAPYNVYLYVYEPGITYSYTMPQVLYKGYKCFFIYTHTFKNGIDFEIKASKSIYSQNTILPEYYNLYGNNTKEGLWLFIRKEF